MDLRFVRLVVALISVQVLKKHLKLTKFWIVQSHVFFDTWKNPWSIWETQISVLLKKKNCAQLDKFNQVKLQTSHPQKVGRSQSHQLPADGALRRSSMTLSSFLRDTPHLPAMETSKSEDQKPLPSLSKSLLGAQLSRAWKFHQGKVLTKQKGAFWCFGAWSD